jgi:hypothetical protein
MNWRTDPPNGWTALYRLLVLAVLCYLTWANANNPNVPKPTEAVSHLLPLP